MTQNSGEAGADLAGQKIPGTAFRHLAAARVAGAEKENSGLVPMFLVHGGSAVSAEKCTSAFKPGGRPLAVPDKHQHDGNFYQDADDGSQCRAR